MSTARRFFLQTPPDGEGAGARLTPEDDEHARRVLRLGPGDPLWGLDGEGHAWPLVVAGEPLEPGAKRSRRPLELELRSGAERRFEPRPGEAGSALPWIELSCALPKGGRAVEMVERLTQLGLAQLNPLSFERSNEAARGAGDARLEKLRRASREACKQSFRLHPLQIAPIATFDAQSATSSDEGHLAILDPRGTLSFTAWASGLDASSPRHLLVGPEGGFSERELEQAAGATSVRLGPHILRIETAAEAATAALVLLASGR